MPVIALLGRPNVGKSTLFNRLTRTRDALVADFPGLTRDRRYGAARVLGNDFTVIDTGGMNDASDADDDIDALIMRQSMLAVDEAELLLLMVDGRQGINAQDEQIAGQLRDTGKPVLLVVNKIDGAHETDMVNEFYALGLGEPVAIAAAQGRGVNQLSEVLLSHFNLQPVTERALPDEPDAPPTFAVIGRPNVGKSTLINRLLGEERLLACPQSGATRDSIDVPLIYNDRRIVLVDTAGVRRRGRVKQTVEKFSVVKTLQAIDRCNVVIMLFDAGDGIVDQDATLLGYTLQRGRALVLAVNKWDQLAPPRRRQIREQLQRKLAFADFADLYFISAKNGSGIFDLLGAATRAHEAAFRRYNTADLNQLLEDMLAEHQPPVARGRRIKLRYMHQGGVNPPRFIIHGNQTALLPENYRRYLINRIQQRLDIRGSPIQLECRSGDNPYAGKPKRASHKTAGNGKRREHRRHG